jgi:hypothetical protein
MQTTPWLSSDAPRQKDIGRVAVALNANGSLSIWGSTITVNLVTELTLLDLFP